MKAKQITKKEEKPLHSILSVNIGLPESETGYMVCTAENVIGAYEKQAAEILKRDGYPPTIEELWAKKESLFPDLANGRGLSQKYSIFWMLWFLKSVRAHIKKNNVDMAVCDMAFAVHWAITAQLKPIASFFDIGASFSKTQSLKAKKPRKSKKQIERDDAICTAWKKKKTSPNSFYISQGKKYNLSPSAIRKIVESRFALNPVKC